MSEWGAPWSWWAGSRIGGLLAIHLEGCFAGNVTHQFWVHLEELSGCDVTPQIVVKSYHDSVAIRGATYEAHVFLIGRGIQGGRKIQANRWFIQPKQGSSKARLARNIDGLCQD